MFIAKGSSSDETVSRKKYTGIGTFGVIAINPTLEEANRIYRTDSDKEPAYSYENENSKGVFVVLICKSEDPDILVRLSYSLSQEKATNRDGSKVQCINAYGDTVWLTKDEFDNGVFPDYAKSMSKDGLRPAYRGEEAIISFLKTYLNIPNSRKYKDGQWYLKSKDDLTACQAFFSKDEIKAMHAGDMTPVKEAIKQQKNNVKILLGVKEYNEKYYQDAYREFVLPTYTEDFMYLKKHLTGRKDSGGYATTDFGQYPYTLKEWTLTVKPSSTEEDAFASKSESNTMPWDLTD